MLILYIVLNFKKIVISLYLDVWLRWGLDQNVAFEMDKWLKLKTQNWLPTCDSFPLIVSQIISSDWFVPLHWFILMYNKHIKGTISDLKFQTSLFFFQTPRFFFFFFLHIQSELHSNKLHIQVLFLQRETILCCWELIFAGKN